MLQLNLPAYNFRIKIHNNKQYIFDNQRKKFVVLTPEEWVRQNFVQFLLFEKKYPVNFIAIEKEITLNGMRKRCDVVVYNSSFEPIMIIEFKAPKVRLTQETFDQAAVYNSKLNVEYLTVSNGLEHYCCRVDTENSRYHFFEQIPEYNSIVS